MKTGGRAYYRDVTYVGPDANVELDGRLGHDRAVDRWADLERDLVSAQTGELTVRVGLAAGARGASPGRGPRAMLMARGWRGRPRSCGPDCTIA